MSESIRKKSPRAPSISLDEAVDRAMRVYEKERRHSAPTEVVAQDLGYKSATSGAALSVLASLRYYGLLERPQEGKLAVCKDVEDYKFTPSESMRSALLVKWLKTPPIFAELLEKYPQALPSDANLRYVLIQRGFTPISSASVISVFQRSVQFARYFERGTAAVDAVVGESGPSDDAIREDAAEVKVEEGNVMAINKGSTDVGITDLDRIPVRLSGNRRAYLLVPTPFYVADKTRLKAQIDLLLTDDAEDTA